MISYSRAGRLRNAMQVLTRMQKAGIEPNLLICNTTIHVLVLTNRLDKALRFMARMQLVGITSDVVTCNTLIKGYCDVHRVEDAMELIAEMPFNGCPHDKVNEIAWDMTGGMFLMTTGNGTVEVLAYPALRPVDTLMAHTAGCYCIAIDPKGRYFAVGSADSLVSLWDISEMLCVRTFTKLEWPVRTISFNHTGEFIASASEDLFIDISNAQTGGTVHQIPCRAAMNSVEWNPKYNLLAYAGDDKNKYQADEGVFRIFGFDSL
ncbi:unnamed protein product [Linum tenue]|uniref:Anaphase-promoting complex subunit 4-like WD40 domain-containing protein n=1 Tax=Linum tenue TaxID=586396 RepID=A0AAV0Q7C5_9ROSI|nr:unnamed protein product [Linum tenue]